MNYYKQEEREMQERRQGGTALCVDFYKGRCPKAVNCHQSLETTHPCFQTTGVNGFKRFNGFRWRLRRILDEGIPVSSAFPSRETLIQSLSDFTLEFLGIARNNLTRIASYLRKAMTKLCIKFLVEADSAIESAFP